MVADVKDIQTVLDMEDAAGEILGFSEVLCTTGKKRPIR